MESASPGSSCGANSLFHNLTPNPLQIFPQMLAHADFFSRKGEVSNINENESANKTYSKGNYCATLPAGVANRPKTPPTDGESPRIVGNKHPFDGIDPMRLIYQNVGTVRSCVASDACEAFMSICFLFLLCQLENEFAAGSYDLVKRSAAFPARFVK